MCVLTPKRLTVILSLGALLVVLAVTPAAAFVAQDGSIEVELTVLEAIILGLVEGLTEYLPVSSTGHLLVANELLGLNSTAESEAAIETYERTTSCATKVGKLWSACVLPCYNGTEGARCPDR